MSRFDDNMENNFFLNNFPSFQTEQQTQHQQHQQQQQQQQQYAAINEKLYLSLANKLAATSSPFASNENLVASSSTLSNSLNAGLDELTNSVNPLSTINQNNYNNAMRRRSLGCYAHQKLLVPMQPLQESSTVASLSNQSLIDQSNSMNWLNNNSRTLRSSSFSFNSFTPTLPLEVPKNRFRRLSTSSMSEFSTNSSFSSGIVTGSPAANVWEKMLQQNQANNNALRNNAKKLLAANASANSTGALIFRKEFSDQLKNLEDKIANTGNMFHRRDDWDILNKVPSDKQNPIHIRLEDEGPYGNDETRCFVLSHFSSLCIREMQCILCENDLQVYDRFPLVDGTLFVSPIVYDKDKAIKATISQKEQYIYAVCLACLNGDHHEVRCKWCKQLWKSSSLQIGTLYKYDIFAAFPCCQKRFECIKCMKPVIDLNTTEPLPFFSSYSEEFECQNCKSKAYHFLKPLNSIYTVIKK